MSGPATETSVADGVGTVRMLRTESRNALGRELTETLLGELERLDRDPGTRCILLAGSAEVFASGGDIDALAEDDPLRTPGHPEAELWRRLGAIEKPIVAAASGWALGAGCELALACDMCVAAEGTQFGQPEVTLGAIPGGGATQRLTRAIGKARAMELVLTGRRFSAEQAFHWGLVNRVAKPRSWLGEANDLAGEVAARAPIATRLGKRAILAAERLGIEEGIERERELFEQAMATEDRVEGATAFIEGRPPRFRNR